MAAGDSASLPKMQVIFAADLNNGIGKDGGLPWRLKQDFKFFAEQTTKTSVTTKRNAVVMGRKCWESIPTGRRPLKNRLNVVISRTLPACETEQLIVSDDLPNVLRKLKLMQESGKIETVWNIGGRELYHWAFRNDLVQRIAMTRIFHDFNADVKLPMIDWTKYSRIFLRDCRENMEEHENGVRYCFEFYERSSTDENRLEQ